MKIGNLEPADQWLRGVKHGFKARGRDFTRHPVMVDWAEGKLTLPQLRLWALQQYNIVRPVEQGEPRTFDHIPERWRPKMVEGYEEERYGTVSGTTSHPELFRQFGRAIGLMPEALEATRPLLPTAALMFFFEFTGRCRPWFYTQAAGGILEDQVPGTYPLIVEGLREHYELGAEGTRFFDVHIYADRDHGEMASEVLQEYAVTAEIRGELENVVNHGIDLLWDMWMVPKTHGEYAA